MDPSEPSKVKPGDKLYAVYEGWGDRPIIESVTVAQASNKRILFTERAGLAFHCFSHIDPRHTPVALTPETAWNQWKDKLTQKKEDLLAEIKRIDKKLQKPIPEVSD